MGRTDKVIDEDAPAFELAMFMRGLRRSSGMTLREISNLGHVSHSTLSQNSDGRFRAWKCIEEWFTALYTAAAKRHRTIPMARDQALARAKELWDTAEGRSRQGSSQRPTRAGDRTANGARDTRLAGPDPTRSTAATADRFVRDSGNRRNTPVRSAQRPARQLRLVPRPEGRTVTRAAGPPAPRPPEPSRQDGQGPTDLRLDTEVVRYPPPTQRQTLAEALRHLVDESVSCSRCTPPARQSAFDNPDIQAVLAGTARATEHDILRIVVACGGTAETINAWQRIIRALTDR